MVNNVNSSSTSPASKLLEQIKRLSEETKKNEGIYPDRKNNSRISDYANSVKDLHMQEKMQKLEKTHVFFLQLPSVQRQPCHLMV